MEHELHAALDALINSGKLEQIVAKYRQRIAEYEPDPSSAGVLWPVDEDELLLLLENAEENLRLWEEIRRLKSLTDYYAMTQANSLRTVCSRQQTPYGLSGSGALSGLIARSGIGGRR